MFWPYNKKNTDKGMSSTKKKKDKIKKLEKIKICSTNNFFKKIIKMSNNENSS